MPTLMAKCRPHPSMWRFWALPASLCVQLAYRGAAWVWLYACMCAMRCSMASVWSPEQLLYFA